LARALSKLGFCSRNQARQVIEAGRVRVNGVIRRSAEFWVDLAADRIEVDGQALGVERRVYLMLNKPRGLVTSAADEKGRATVFECLAGKGLPFLAPVGRLDQASEGLLLFTNDGEWAASITNPTSRLDKTYHVQVNCVADAPLVGRMEAGAECDGELLAAKRASVLRQGGRNSWLEVVLDEGKNRQIRRLLAALEVEVLRLVRVSIGPLRLRELAKGQFRLLTDAEVKAMSRCASAR
jgi:23S rRNA pseudouridine2605 synthase